MSFSFAMRYLRYKFPHLKNIIEPSIDLKKLNCIWSEEFKSRFVIDDNGNACLPASYAYKLLSADFLSFVHNYLPWQIDLRALRYHCECHTAGAGVGRACDVRVFEYHHIAGKNLC